MAECRQLFSSVWSTEITPRAACACIRRLRKQACGEDEQVWGAARYAVIYCNGSPQRPNLVSPDTIPPPQPFSVYGGVKVTF